MKKAVISVVVLVCCIFGYNFYLNMKIDFIQNEIINSIQKSKYLTLDQATLEKSLNSAASEIYFSYEVPNYSGSMMVEIYYKKNFFHFRPIEVMGDVNFVDQNGLKLQNSIFGNNPIADFLVNVSLTGIDANLVINSMKLERKSDNLDFNATTSPIVIGATLNNFGKISKYEMLLADLNLTTLVDSLNIKNISSNIVFKKPVSLSQFGDLKSVDMEFLELDKIEEFSTKGVKFLGMSVFSDAKIKNLAYNVDSNLKIDQINIAQLNSDDNNSYQFDFTSKFNTKISFDENASILSYNYDIDSAILSSLSENSSLSFTIEDLKTNFKFLTPQKIMEIVKNNPSYEANATVKNISLNGDNYLLSLDNVKSDVELISDGVDKFNFKNIVNIDNLVLNDQSFGIKLAYDIEDFNIYALSKDVNGVDKLIRELPNSKFRVNYFDLVNKNNNSFVKSNFDLEFYGKHITKDTIFANFDINSNIEFSQSVLSLVDEANPFIYSILMQNLNYLTQENYIEYKDKIYKTNIKYIGQFGQILLNNQPFVF